MKEYQWKEEEERGEQRGVLYVGSHKATENRGVLWRRYGQQKSQAVFEECRKGRNDFSKIGSVERF